jgi:hypothetical protein
MHRADNKTENTIMQKQQHSTERQTSVETTVQSLEHTPHITGCEKGSKKTIKKIEKEEIVPARCKRLPSIFWFAFSNFDIPLHVSFFVFNLNFFYKLSGVTYPEAGASAWLSARAAERTQQRVALNTQHITHETRNHAVREETQTHTRHSRAMDVLQHCC